MAKLHHAAMEELSGYLAGLSDCAGAFEFEPEPGPYPRYVATIPVETDNFRLSLTVVTHPGAIEEEGE